MLNLSQLCKNVFISLSFSLSDDEDDNKNFIQLLKCSYCSSSIISHFFLSSFSLSFSFTHSFYLFLQVFQSFFKCKYLKSYREECTNSSLVSFSFPDACWILVPHWVILVSASVSCEFHTTYIYTSDVPSDVIRSIAISHLKKLFLCFYCYCCCCFLCLISFTFLLQLHMTNGRNEHNIHRAEASSLVLIVEILM